MKRIMMMLLLCSLYGASQEVDVVAKARRHPIEMNKPAVNFFEGAVLGNGGMGVVVVTRPDAVMFHFGHNNVWDIRIAEDNREAVGTFDQIFRKAKALSPDLKNINDDDEFRAYLDLMAANYRKPYPRPFPCGSVVLGFDRRKVELLGHRIDISNGLCEVYLLRDGVKNVLEIFTAPSDDVLWFRLTDAQGVPQPTCFDRLRLIPDGSTPREMPKYTTTNTAASLSFTQILPYQEPEAYDLEKGHPNDRAFRLEAALSSPLTEGVHYNTLGVAQPLQPLERYIVDDGRPLIGKVSLREGLASSVRTAQPVAPPDLQPYREALREANIQWTAYWNKSGVTLADDFLEKIWYWNHYFFNCAVKAGVTCPGLFANWSRGNIGTAWHGDFHMNYNTQQPFWLPFSSNRLDKNIPYVDMVHHLLPISRRWAKEYYGMRGAFFPHSAYPVDMTLHPYPVPDWGWEVFETPWTVQGLWWHYLYSMNVDFLRDRAYAPIKDAVLFLVDYMKRPDAHGNARWNDDRYHLFPSVPPELYGLQPGFKFNYDTQVDITLTRFLFNAFLQAVEELKYQKQEAKLLEEVRHILARMPDYSTASSEEYGTIYTSVPGENDRMVYNLPANLLHVFPGEEFGIDAPKDVYDVLLNTYKAHQNEGGNEIVLLNLQAARLGILDIEKFKRQVNYAMLPNKTVADYVLQSGGRYVDETGFDWMGSLGIWFENFALPVVINECLMQSYNGVIRLFPNWSASTDASFTTLRAAGAFLVSCKQVGGRVSDLTILSEKGSLCKLKNPWGEASVLLLRNGKPAEKLKGELLTFQTAVDEKIEFKPETEPTTAIVDRWQPLPYGDVKVGGEIGRRLDVTIHNHLEKIDLEKDFLHAFDVKDKREGFIGAGMLLDAVVHLAAGTGDTTVIGIKNRIAERLIATQQADGYIGFFADSARLWREWDIHEMAYIITGLVSDYVHFGRKKSLDAAVKTADYILSHWSSKPVDFPDFYLLGIDNALFSLYRQTGAERFLTFSRDQKSLIWNPGIVKGRTGDMTGHIFAYLAVTEAQMNKYRFFPEAQLTAATRSAMRHLAEGGMTITGGAGQEEVWDDTQDGTGDHAETCATGYQIRMYDNLLRLEGDLQYGDLMERSIYNVLFASQSPDGRKIRYYTPFEGKRVYFNSDAYCCPNNFRRIMSEIPQMIYYHRPDAGDDNGVLINLYTTSSARIRFADGIHLSIEQETDYPNSGNIELRLTPSKPRSFPLTLRIPRWATAGLVEVNGIPIARKVIPGEPYTIDRKWKKNDRVRIILGMEIRLIEGQRRQSGRVAVMRGPLVYGFSAVANPGIKIPSDDPHYLGRFTLDPRSLRVVPDSTVRDTGTACLVGVWSPGFNPKSGKHDHVLKLTEFPDPENIGIYFCLPAGSIAEKDELMEITDLEAPLHESIMGFIWDPTDMVLPEKDEKAVE